MFPRLPTPGNDPSPNSDLDAAILAAWNAGIAFTSACPELRECVLRLGEPHGCTWFYAACVTSGLFVSQPRHISKAGRWMAPANPASERRFCILRQANYQFGALTIGRNGLQGPRFQFGPVLAFDYEGCRASKRELPLPRSEAEGGIL